MKVIQNYTKYNFDLIKHPFSCTPYTFILFYTVFPPPHKPLLFHKGHIYAKKYSEAWKILNKTQRDFSDFKQDTGSAHIETDEPVAARLRSKNQIMNILKALKAQTV